MQTERRWAYLLAALIVSIPAVLLILRAATGGVVGYGWGWQMFS